MWIFLSPHLDDAVWSCGGLLYRLGQQGVPTAVWTFMAGDTPSDPPQTPLVQQLHARWNLGSQPLAARRQEDYAALHLLGAQALHLPFLDAPYRTDAQGLPLYPQRDDLFAPLHPQDPALHYALTLPDELTHLVVPLGVGSHVDHQVTHAFARCLPPQARLLYYEEYPYSAAPLPAGQASGALHPAIRRALDACGQQLSAEVITLTAAEAAAKVAAMACYSSQVDTFWQNSATMEQQVRAYMQQIASPYGERYWQPDKR